MSKEAKYISLFPFTINYCMYMYMYIHTVHVYCVSYLHVYTCAWHTHI